MREITQVIVELLNSLLNVCLFLNNFVILIYFFFFQNIFFIIPFLNKIVDILGIDILAQ